MNLNYSFLNLSEFFLVENRLFSDFDFLVTDAKEISVLFASRKLFSLKKIIKIFFTTDKRNLYFSILQEDFVRQSFLIKDFKNNVIYKIKFSNFEYEILNENNVLIGRIRIKDFSATSTVSIIKQCEIYLENEIIGVIERVNLSKLLIRLNDTAKYSLDRRIGVAIAMILI